MLIRPMAQMTSEQITAALNAGIISNAQAKAMLAQLTPDAQNEATIGNEENLRFIRGFSDVFIAIGIGILMLGLASLSFLFGSGIYLIAIALFAAVMAEYFGRKKRAHLPTLITALAFLFYTLKGTSHFLSGSPVLAAAIVLIAMSLFYWRVRLPFCIALITVSALYLGLAVLKHIAPDFVRHQFGWVMALGGLITLIGGIYYDSKDLHRSTRFSDNAFWLHLTAAPLLIHGSVLELVKTQTTQVLGLVPVIDVSQGDAVLMLVIVAIVTVIGLVLNRRALIVSSLFYALIAVGYLLTKSGVSLTMALTLTLILIGAAIVLLGIGWHPVRNAIIKAVPKSRFIPIPYDSNFK
ncbi:MAG: hypothetical protein ABJ275_05390 [Maricaulaceae bacterium]